MSNGLPPIHRVRFRDEHEVLYAARIGNYWITDFGTPVAAFITDVGPADVLVLPAPSGPVVRKSWGWLCGDTEAEDLEGADGWAAELPQHIADSRAIAAHIRGLTAEQVWLDPEPVVPRPEPGAPMLAGDVATVRAWVEITAALAPGMSAALNRVLAAAETQVTE